MENGDKFTAPYLPFRTFETALDHLAALGGIPAKVDHSIFPSIGGVLKGQVISAFKFLGLIDASGTPALGLSELALKKETRKETLRKILREKYPNISEAELATMSPGHLETKLSDAQYNVQGDTRNKARTFLLKAAVYTGIPLSKLLTQKGAVGPRKKRVKDGPDKTKGMQDNRQHIEKPIIQNNTSKTVTLRCGGELSLSYTVNLWDLVGQDREFVFGLIDQIKAFEKTQESSKG